MLFALLALLGPGAGSALRAQGTDRAFSVFIDCSGFYCEPDFFRSDITFVDHVRERTAADVHVLVTRTRTGGGGSEFALAFYGQRRFGGLVDTVTVRMPQGATEDESRRVLSRTIKLGLARYLVRTEAADGATLTVAARAAEGARPAGPARDPWNAWVFSIGSNVNASRERNYGNTFVFGRIEASRVTPIWKTNLRVYENYSDQTFSVRSEAVTSVRRDFGGGAQQVRSLGEHWSAGMKADAGSSTFLNEQLVASATPVVEYDVFPYSDYTRRALLVQYAVGGRYFRYNDTTVFYKIREARPFQSLNLALSQKQKWGSLNFEVSGYHFLDDLGKSRLTFYGQADVRVFRGLSLNLFGNYSVLHDQLYLAKGNLSRDEVLLRQSQLATTYRGFLYMGIRYTFGSVLNNVVNPRMDNSSNNF